MTKIIIYSKNKEHFVRLKSFCKEIKWNIGNKRWGVDNYWE
ncbi:MAG: hypothetical protein AABW88_02565 [Nanoarchaeota archaeon]